jgi:hypothetical protein
MSKLDFAGRNAWLSFGPLEVYIRKSEIPTELGRNLQIANVSVPAQEQQHGHFTRFLDMIETYARDNQWDSVYVENVLNPVLERFLLKHGYDVFKKHGWAQWPPCLYKRIEHVRR